MKLGFSVSSRRYSGTMGQFAAVTVLDDVIAAATAAIQTIRLTKTISANTHPSSVNCGNPHDKCVVRNITCDHGTGGHKAILAYYHAADDRCIRPDGSASSHQSSSVLMFSFDVAAWVDYIRED